MPDPAPGQVHALQVEQPDASESVCRKYLKVVARHVQHLRDRVDARRHGDQQLVTALDTLLSTLPLALTRFRASVGQNNGRAGGHHHRDRQPQMPPVDHHAARPIARA